MPGQVVSSRAEGLAARVAEERRAFDESFARARSGAPAARESALRIAVGGDAYVVRLSEVGGVFLDRPVTRLPGEAKGFFGVAGIGASFVPVWDLRVLLGYAAPGRPRWVLSAAAASVALAFDGCTGHLGPEAGAFSPTEAGARREGLVRETVRWEGSLLPVLCVDAVLDNIRSLARPGAGRKER